MSLWHYQAQVDRIVDGDTIDVVIDQGFHNITKQRLRLAGINTPEVRGIEKVEGIAAADFVTAWVEEVEGQHLEYEWPFMVETGKTGKYGRWITRLTAASDWSNCLNDRLDAAGHNKTPGYGPGKWT